MNCYVYEIGEYLLLSEGKRKEKEKDEIPLHDDNNTGIILWGIILKYLKYYNFDIYYDYRVIYIKDSDAQIYNNVVFMIKEIVNGYNNINVNIPVERVLHRQIRDKHHIDRELFYEWCDKNIEYSDNSYLPLYEVSQIITNRSKNAYIIGKYLKEYFDYKGKNIKYDRCKIDGFKQKYWHGVKINNRNETETEQKIDSSHNLFLHKNDDSKNHIILTCLEDEIEGYKVIKSFKTNHKDFVISLVNDSLLNIVFYPFDGGCWEYKCKDKYDLSEHIENLLNQYISYFNKLDAAIYPDNTNNANNNNNNSLRRYTVYNNRYIIKEEEFVKWCDKHIKLKQDGYIDIHELTNKYMNFSEYKQVNKISICFDDYIKSKNLNVKKSRKLLKGSKVYIWKGVTIL